MSNVHLGVLLGDMPTSHPLRNVLFDASEFFWSHVSPILLSYVEAKPRVLIDFQSLYQSFEDTNIDSRIHAFIDEFALNGYSLFLFVFYYMWTWG
jgi:hypothetical protein